MLNAFWRVAPSVRFRVRAIFAAGVFFRASVFNSRMCVGVQDSLFFPFFIFISLYHADAFSWKGFKRKAPDALFKS
jgi:hypothetical protein